MTLSLIRQNDRTVGDRSSLLLLSQQVLVLLREVACSAHDARYDVLCSHSSLSGDVDADSKERQRIPLSATSMHFTLNLSHARTSYVSIDAAL